MVLKLALGQMNGDSLMLIQFVIAAILQGLVCWKKKIRIGKSDVLWGVMIGVLMYGIFAAQIQGLLYSTAIKQAFILGTNILFVPLIWWMVSGDKPGLSNLLGILSGMVGILLLTRPFGQSGLNIGDLWSLVCAIFIAAQVVTIGLSARKTSGSGMVWIQFITAAALFGFTGWKGALVVFTDSGMTIMPYILYMSIFPTFLAFGFQNKAQAHLHPSTASLLLTFETVFGSMLALIVFGEAFTPFMIAGSVFIIAAILLAELKPFDMKGGVGRIT